MLIENFIPLKKYISRYRKKILMGLVFLFFTNTISLIAPLALKYAINALKNITDTSVLLKYAGLILGVTILQGIFRYFMRRILIGVSRVMEYDLRNDLFAHLQKFSRSYFIHTKTGDTM